MPLTAKFATTCPACSGSVQPGEQIAKVGSGWGHVACAAGVQGELLASAPSSASSSAPAAAKRGTTTSSRSARARPADMVAAEGALEVWTDGACSGNPGPGGWAWATKDGRQDSGGAPATTNQRMEIQAALEAVTALPGALVVVSDSTYVVNCFRDRWWEGWLSRGWTTSAKKPVANRDLWEPLVTAFRERGDVSFRWVKGHSGDEMNDKVDRLAVEAGRAVVS